MRRFGACFQPGRVNMLLDNIGLPNSGINLAFSSSPPISNSDGEILISLNPGPKQTEEFMRLLRDDLRQKFPDGTFFFAPANITNQILDFGLPAPIDLQVIGHGKDNYALATKLEKEVAADSGRRGCAFASASGVPDAECERGPHEGQTDWPDAAGRCAVDAHLAVRHSRRLRQTSG